MPQQKQKKKQIKNKFSFTSVVIVVIVIALLALVSYGVYCIIDEQKPITDTTSYVDEEKDTAVITYPASLFDDVQATADSMKGTDGMKKVQVNADGSLTLKVTMERYEKIKSAADNAANVIPYTHITETSAVRDYIANDDRTEITVTVIKDIETLSEEIKNIVYVVRLYHVCLAKSDENITLIYKDAKNGEVYLTEVYDINGNIVKTEPSTVI